MTRRKRSEIGGRSLVCLENDSLCFQRLTLDRFWEIVFILSGDLVVGPFSS
jgi:hypothetical protein